MAAESAVTESGQPVHSQGLATLHGLQFQCDGSLAGQVWGAGAALARHLLENGLPGHDPRSLVVVEVGSGTGVAGLAAALAGARRTVLTDMPDVVDSLQAQVRLNEELLGDAVVEAVGLEWGDAAAAEAACEDGCDLVLAADCLYSGDPAVHQALRETMVALAKVRDAPILHAYEERWQSIFELWRSGREAGGLRVVHETTLEPPPSIQGRRLVLEELCVSEDALFS
jgi:hypothetical protein